MGSSTLPISIPAADARPWFVWGVAGGMLLTFAEPVLTYAQDHHYQTHFLFLWAFFAAAVWRAGRGHLQPYVLLGTRAKLGYAIAALGLVLWHAGLTTGSSTAQRLALVMTFAAVSLWAMRGWSLARCLGYAAFALLCFGLPYSAYSQATLGFREVIVDLLVLLPNITPLQFTVDGLALQFAHFRLAITDDCSGCQQILTFVGLALVGILTSRTGFRRAALLLTLGIALAGISNLARILVFVVLVASGQQRFVEDQDLHAWTGLLVYAPFLLAFIAIILKTHVPLPPPGRTTACATTRRVWLPWLLLPFVVLRLLHLHHPTPDPTTPAFFANLQLPEGWTVSQRAPSEGHERRVYDTPWLVNVVCTRPDAAPFELFSYVTRSRRHLAVHQIAHCLDVPGTEVVYGPAVEVDGRRFWTFEVIAAHTRHHGYFAFWVDGQDRDDNLSTQLAVFVQRLTSGVAEVGLTRLLLPGPLVLPLPDADRELLAWRARQLRAVRVAG